MRTVLSIIVFALLMAALTVTARAAAPDPPPLIAPDPPPLAQRVQSLESRAAELEARIRVLEARELAPEVAKPSSPFTVSRSFVSPASSTTPDIRALVAATADTQPTSNSEVAPSAELMYTAAPKTVRSGTTSGCANGACGAATTYTTGRSGGWYPGRLLGR